MKYLLNIIYIRYQWNSHSVVKKFFLWSAQLYLGYTELEVSAGHWTKSDIKTAMSDAKSPYAWLLWATCFWAFKNTLTIQYIILLFLHWLSFYSFIIFFMILCVFFSSNVSCYSYKEFFSYSFCVKILFNFLTSGNSLDALCFCMFMRINKDM